MRCIVKGIGTLHAFDRSRQRVTFVAGGELENEKFSDGESLPAELHGELARHQIRVERLARLAETPQSIDPPTRH